MKATVAYYFTAWVAFAVGLNALCYYHGSDTPNGRTFHAQGYSFGQYLTWSITPVAK